MEKQQIIEKKSHNAEKVKGGPFGIFKHPICCKILKKLKGGPYGEKKILEKSQCRKTEKGDPLGFFNIHSVAKQEKICYAEKQEKPFWFSSLRQMVQFGSIIFCRTFKNYFGHFVWIEKKSL